MRYFARRSPADLAGLLSLGGNPLLQFSASSRQALITLRHRQQQQQLLLLQPRGMTEWAQEWSSALGRHNKEEVDTDWRAAEHLSAIPTPHPALASSREAAEWEAVLTAAEAAAPANDSSEGRVVQTADYSDGHSMSVYAVVECGSQSTRLLLSTGQRDVVGSALVSFQFDFEPTPKAIIATPPPLLLACYSRSAVLLKWLQLSCKTLACACCWCLLIDAGAYFLMAVCGRAA